MQRLLFSSHNMVNYRLQRLYQQSLLDRRWRAVEYGYGTGQAIYMLAKSGSELIAQNTEERSQATGWRKASYSAHSPFLEHILMVNDVRITFTLGAQ